MGFFGVLARACVGLVSGGELLSYLLPFAFFQGSCVSLPWHWSADCRQVLSFQRGGAEAPRPSFAIPLLLRDQPLRAHAICAELSAESAAALSVGLATGLKLPRLTSIGKNLSRISGDGFFTSRPTPSPADPSFGRPGVCRC